MPGHVASDGTAILLGIMSGTSGDGIDVAAVRISGRGLNMRPAFLEHLHRDFPAKLRSRLLAIMAPAETRTEEIASLHSELGHAYADAALEMIRRLGPRRRPVAIGLAGQTVCHLPGKALSNQRSALSRHSALATCRNKGRLRVLPHTLTVTLQLGNPHILAARTGLPVIADFRQSDVAAGGQGAPLVPWTDWVLFHREPESCAVQNIGGIGNVTYIPAGGRPEDVIAFDTGPGNMIIDALVQHVSGRRERMDRDGHRARRGRVLPSVLARWMKHPFLQLSPPRTTGRETFGRQFVEAELPRLLRASENPDDWIATATAFTAATIANAYRRFLPDGRLASSEARAGDPAWTNLADASSRWLAARASSDRRKTAKKTASQGNSVKNTPLKVILCGGGARNTTLREWIVAALPEAVVETIDAHGIPSEAKEAVSFAILARAALDRVPANLPQATGAAYPACLGVRTDPP